ncbi:cation:proton antiporter [Parabacteroides acidifaciens]|uniref:Cation:proton antiporter n=1 Tax=Parabacteroides acidifaciens TaxID=2290935 RepID=A0A3D8HI56_9BACT|nr:cation:proton antiporter [Parabacteroides acidifaciens]MBC8600675.1 cation:proton antiporter [Parabacteroides acidifaciens]RDU50674.1 sodium:proton antiporter [Parabacteroides acidifaciens]
MSQIPSLISDLAVILISAGLVTLLFKRLKQPVVLGYIVAGILAGPAITQIPTVTNVESIRIWADIGVIFLLFALGLDFSFKKLMKVGGTAVIGAITIVIGMMTLGYTTGLSLGWGHMNSLFLGGMLSMSSTTIIFKAFDDMGLRNQRFAGVVFGILVVEDLFAVLLMVLLSTLAVSKHVEGMELLNSVIKLGVFLLFCFVIGIYLIPSFLKKARTFLNDETLLIVSLGLCLGMVIIATKAGFSSALGAFVMGSILAETIEAEHIEHLIKPVKDLFGAIFFVSVGMLIDPALLWEYKIPILILTLVVMVGQILFASFGVLLSGQPVKIAIHSGFSLAQIGEFAFIIASLGLTLGVTDNFLYPIVVAVSVITTFFTPYMIRMAEPACRVADRIIPKSWMKFLERYSSGSNTIHQKSAWNKLLKALTRIVGTYTAVTLVLIFIWLQFVAPFIMKEISGLRGAIISLVLILLLIAPMLRAIMMKKNHSAEFQQLWLDSKYNRGPLVSLIILRIILCIGLVMLPVTRLLNAAVGILLAIAATVIVIVILSKRLKRQSILMERHFFSNLTARELEYERKAPINQRFANHLLERDLHLADFEVRQNSPSMGKTLKELNFRQKCNVNIVTIIRGEKRINIPGGEERLYPFDKLVVVGADDDLEHFRQYLVERYKTAQTSKKETKEVNMEQFTIAEGSRLIGRTILESGIRDKAACLVIGIERGETSIKNPSPTTVFEEGDIVWIVGEHDKVLRLSEGKTVGNS